MYKYQDKIEQFKNCPPSRYKEIEKEHAFRFVHEVDDPNSFVPQYVKKPSRIVPGDDKRNCDGYALSLFNSQQEAKKRYRALLRRVGKRFSNDAGRKIAVCRIQTNDGKCSPIGGSGHFELHEYADVKLLGRFTSVESLTIIEVYDEDGKSSFDLG